MTMSPQDPTHPFHPPALLIADVLSSGALDETPTVPSRAVRHRARQRRDRVVLFIASTFGLMALVSLPIIQEVIPTIPRLLSPSSVALDTGPYLDGSAGGQEGSPSEPGLAVGQLNPEPEVGPAGSGGATGAGGTGSNPRPPVDTGPPGLVHPPGVQPPGMGDPDPPLHHQVIGHGPVHILNQLVPGADGAFASEEAVRRTAWRRWKAIVARAQWGPDGGETWPRAARKVQSVLKGTDGSAARPPHDAVDEPRGHAAGRSHHGHGGGA